MTWVQIGVGLAGLFVASAGVALAGWFGIWTMMDRRFAEMRAEMRAGFDRGDTRLDALVADVHTLGAAVHTLVGRQQERDRTADD